MAHNIALGLVLAVSLGALAAPAAASDGTAVLLGRGDVLALWKVVSGPANVTLSSDVAPWSGLPYLNVSYNLTDGYAAYVSPAAEDAVSGVPDVIAVSFSFFLPPGAPETGAVVTVTDGNGTGFGCNPWLFANGWTNFSIPLPNGTVEDKMWWPAQRTMALPLKSVAFGVNKHTPATGWVGVADAALVTSRAPGAIPHAVSMALLQPRHDVSGVIVAGGGDGPTALGVEVTNRLRMPCGVAVAVEMRNATGPMGVAEWAPCGPAAPAVLAPWQSLALTCVVDPAASPAGYVAVRGVISASDCWTANDTQTAVEAAVVVALPQPPVTPALRNVRAAVFGGQMVPSFGAITRIGMWSVRSGPMWRWAQTAECWTPDCFGGFAQFYDAEVFGASAAGVELMLDARAVPAAVWSVATNASGPTWQSFPGPAHYGDFTRYLTVMLDRYGAMATSVEVDNEDDGIHYFMPQPPPMDYVQNLSLALINCTAAAVAASANGSGLELMGLSASLFDVMQEGNGGSAYMAYEEAILGAPGVIGALAAVTAHPYTLGQVPFTAEPWGNVSFLFPNERAPGRNSTVAALQALAALMTAKAQAAGLPGYRPRLRPSEAGYDLELDASASGGWAMMHAALIAQLLLHMRSAPLAAHVEKFFLFAAYDGCCVESGGYFGAFRPGLVRTGINATLDLQPPTAWTADTVPLPAAAAYATASALADVPSGRLPGVFVVDNSAAPGLGAPSCVAFEPDPASPLQPPPAPLAVLMTTAHHYNDRTPATLRVATAQPGAVLLRNGLGTPLPGAVAPAPGGAAVTLSLAALPQYLLLPADASAAAACATLSY